MTGEDKERSGAYLQERTDSPAPMALANFLLVFVLVRVARVCQSGGLGMTCLSRVRRQTGTAGRLLPVAATRLSRRPPAYVRFFYVLQPAEKGVRCRIVRVVTAALLLVGVFESVRGASPDGLRLVSQGQVGASQPRTMGSRLFPARRPPVTSHTHECRRRKGSTGLEVASSSSWQL